MVCKKYKGIHILISEQKIMVYKYVNYAVDSK
jgi:hypothetical protein